MRRVGDSPLEGEADFREYLLVVGWIPGSTLHLRSESIPSCGFLE